MFLKAHGCAVTYVWYRLTLLWLKYKYPCVFLLASGFRKSTLLASPPRVPASPRLIFRLARYPLPRPGMSASRMISLPSFMASSSKAHSELQISFLCSYFRPVAVTWHVACLPKSQLWNISSEKHPRVGCTVKLPWSAGTSFICGILHHGKASASMTTLLDIVDYWLIFAFEYVWVISYFVT